MEGVVDLSSAPHLALPLPVDVLFNNRHAAKFSGIVSTVVSVQRSVFTCAPTNTHGNAHLFAGVPGIYTRFNPRLRESRGPYKSLTHKRDTRRCSSPKQTFCSIELTVPLD